jgi:hypothetical protein
MNLRIWVNRSNAVFALASAQVKNQFFASLARFRYRPAFAGWTWLETEVRNPHGGFLFGRATDTSGNIEGLHDQPGSPAAILVDEAKSIRDEVLDALERCHTSYPLFMSSTGAASPAVGCRRIEFALIFGNHEVIL